MNKILSQALKKAVSEYSPKVNEVQNDKRPDLFSLNNETELNFEKCLVDENIEDHVLNDRINGVKKFNINSTPTLIINDKKFDNPNNYKKLKKSIEKLI